MGSPGAGEEVEALARSEGTVDDEPRRVWRALMQALADADDLLAANPKGPWKSPYEFKIAQILTPERFLVRLPAECGQLMRAVTRNARASLAADKAAPWLEDMSRRSALVAMYDQPVLWWHDREPHPRPTPRELALVTLLAGEFPTVRLPSTVAEVLKAEWKATNEALKRIRRWRRESITTRVRARTAVRG